MRTRNIRHISSFSAPIAFLLFISLTIFLPSCASDSAQTISNTAPANSPATIADTFAYPVGSSEFVTQAKDKKDDWFNALDFRKDNHLGEDWNKNSGGNTDCGEPVYAIANGVITYAQDAGPGWGNVVIITHTLPDGAKVQSLYGHLQEILKTSGEVKKREQIGKIGNANGRYLCHLHLELRDQDARDWDKVGGGYSSESGGWLDPSDFIDERRKQER
ncbi:MAG: M23 family metallopeptidase [Chloracidobacterium sp.]|nr:M23 family metallopeptidase [Chloracidobacterium sp.]